MAAATIPNYLDIQALSVFASGDPRQPKSIRTSIKVFINRQDVVYIQEVILGEDYINAVDYDGKIYLVRLKNRRNYLISSETFNNLFGYSQTSTTRFSNVSGNTILSTIYLTELTARFAVSSATKLTVSGDRGDVTVYRMLMADGSYLTVLEGVWESIVQFTQISI